MSKRIICTFFTLSLAACTTATTALPPDMSTGCADNTACASSTTGPICHANVCVVCGGNADCPPGKKCLNNMACVACTGAGDCPAGQKCTDQHTCAQGCDTTNPCPTGMLCDTGGGSCVTCLSDKDCGGRACDGTTHACVDCTSDDICGPGKLCHAQTCVTGCSGAHPQCPMGQVCNVPATSCVACLGDNDCGGGGLRCDTTLNQCVACLAANDNCPAGQYCRAETCATVARPTATAPASSAT